MKPRPSFPAKLETTAPKAPKQPLSSKTWAAQLQAQSKGVASPTQASGLGLDSATVRENMVRKLMDQGVEDPMVLSALGTIERHRFSDILHDLTSLATEP